MIHAQIDTVEHRQIVGFEVGTRAQFDTRHAGDPLWIFVDSYRVKYRANFASFLRTPTGYKVDLSGDLVPSTDAPIIVVEILPTPIPGYDFLKGTDGKYLLSDTGEYLMGRSPGYVPPPDGEVYLIDPDGTFVADPDGDFLREPI